MLTWRWMAASRPSAGWLTTILRLALTAAMCSGDSWNTPSAASWLSTGTRTRPASSPAAVNTPGARRPLAGRRRRSSAASVRFSIMAMNLQFSNESQVTHTLFGVLSQPHSRSCKLVSINDPGDGVVAVKDRVPSNSTQAPCPTSVASPDTTEYTLRPKLRRLFLRQPPGAGPPAF